MEKKPLLIRPSMASKTSPKNKFCSKSLPTMGTSTRFLCVIFYVLLQSLCKIHILITKNLLKVSQNWAKSMQGSGECIHVLFI